MICLPYFAISSSLEELPLGKEEVILGNPELVLCLFDSKSPANSIFPNQFSIEFVQQKFKCIFALRNNV